VIQSDDVIEMMTVRKWL